MKKIILSLVTIACAASVAFAQNYEDIKNLLYLKQYKKAKEQLDKSWTNAKFVSKPEAYILKANVLSGLSTDSSMASEAASLRAQSREAFDKYREMDPKMALVVEPNSIYSAAPIIMYGGYFNDGISNFRDKNYPVAFENFKSAVEISDILREFKLANIQLDTNAILLAGASAQSMKKDDVAEQYFVKLADAKVGGAENEFMYQFLANRALQKGDMVAFNKYLALGKELYPSSKYFQYDELDYILAMENESDKMRLIDQKIAANPNDFKTQSALGEILFDQLNPKEGEPTVANYDETEKKMVGAFEKAAELDQNSGLAYSNLGNHFINKSNKLAKALDSVKAVIRQKNQANKPATPPKAGTKPPPATLKVDPADAAARDELSKKYETASDKAREYYEKAANVYAKNTSPSLIEKQQYRNAVGYLVDLCAEKKNNSKATPSLYDKWEKEEKKWSDLYHKM